MNNGNESANNNPFLFLTHVHNTAFISIKQQSGHGPNMQVICTYNSYCLLSNLCDFAIHVYKFKTFWWCFFGKVSGLKI